MAVKRYDSATSSWVTVAGLGAQGPAGANGSDGSAPLTTKGDLLTYSTSATRLGIGSNGETLVADSSASTGLRWQGNFAAGKNKIINGDFNINQRNFSSSTTTSAYNFDRWQQVFSGGTQTITPQSFTLGTAPVAGYEGKTFCRIVTASQSAAGDYSAQTQKIESVRTFAGQTITVSFWAKAASGTPNIGLSGLQNFGTGGSPSSNVIVTGSTTAITTSWARYSFTLSVPSISGKTIGTNNDDHFRVDLWTSVGTTISGLGYPAVGLQNVTIDVWGFQAEIGSVATAFQTATGTLAGELAACQRYYYDHSTGNNLTLGVGFYYSSSDVRLYVKFPVTMRTTPTVVATSGTNYYCISSNGGDDFINSLIIARGAASGCLVYNNSEAAGTSGYAGEFRNANASASLAFNAEL